MPRLYRLPRRRHCPPLPRPRPPRPPAGLQPACSPSVTRPGWPGRKRERKESDLAKWPSRNCKTAFSAVRPSVGTPSQAKSRDILRQSDVTRGSHQSRFALSFAAPSASFRGRSSSKERKSTKQKNGSIQIPSCQKSLLSNETIVTCPYWATKKQQSYNFLLLILCYLTIATILYIFNSLFVLGSSSVKYTNNEKSNLPNTASERRL